MTRGPKGTPHAGFKKSILEEGFDNGIEMDLQSGFRKDSLSFLKESEGFLKNFLSVLLGSLKDSSLQQTISNP